MRLWHKDLIPALPTQQLKGQWSEVSAIAGSILLNGTPNHLLVNKSILYPYDHLTTYAELIYTERKKRGMRTSESVLDKVYRLCDNHRTVPHDELFEGWYNDRYLRQCYYNLQEKYDCGGIPAEEWERIEKAVLGVEGCII